MVARMESGKPADKPEVTARKKKSPDPAPKKSPDSASAGFDAKRKKGKKESISERSKRPTQPIIFQPAGSGAHADLSEGQKFLKLMDELEAEIEPEIVVDQLADTLTNLPPPRAGLSLPADTMTSASSAPGFLSTAAPERMASPNASPRARNPAKRQKPKESGPSPNHRASFDPVYSFGPQPAPKRLPGKKDPRRLSQPSFYLPQENEGRQESAISTTRAERMAARHSQPTTSAEIGGMAMRVKRLRGHAERLRSELESYDTPQKFWDKEKARFEKRLGKNVHHAIDKMMMSLPSDLADVKSLRPQSFMMMLVSAIGDVTLDTSTKVAILDVARTKFLSQISSMADRGERTMSMLVKFIAEVLDFGKASGVI